MGRSSKLPERLDSETEERSGSRWCKLDTASKSLDRPSQSSTAERSVERAPAVVLANGFYGHACSYSLNLSYFDGVARSHCFARTCVDGFSVANVGLLELPGIEVDPSSRPGGALIVEAVEARSSCRLRSDQFFSWRLRLFLDSSLKESTPNKTSHCLNFQTEPHGRLVNVPRFSHAGSMFDSSNV